MNVMITGASGLIGSYLCDFLLKQGYDVTATARSKNKINFFPYGRFTAFEMDVLEPVSINKISKVAIDAIVHTATANDIVSKNTKEGILLSAIGTKNMLEFCVKRKIQKFIYFSTLQVYGTELTGLINENTTLNCQNDYALNHLFGELYVEMYAREKNMAGIVVRPSNVYGRFLSPYINRWTLVPGCFCKEVYETGEITLKSSGKQTRNFVSLHEVSAGVDALLNSNKKGYYCYNIASAKNFSILQAAKKVKICYEKRFGKKATLNLLGVEPRKGNKFRVDISKISQLGYRPDENYSLESEINQLFDHLEKKSHEPGRKI